MKLSDFDYDLPTDLIAQNPVRPRDASRMLVLHREGGEIEHRHFRDLLDYLRPDDAVVLNDTRVIRARLTGHRQPGGGKVEVLLLSETQPGVWEALVTPGRRVQPGREIVFGDGELRAKVVASTPSGGRMLSFSPSSGVRRMLAWLGDVPLPPYIHEPIRDESDYQTVYSRTPGSSAAPTAGLHFTPEMLKAVEARCGEVSAVTLHIGLGSFRPIRVEDVEDHQMHAESYAVPEPTAVAVSRAVAEGRRVMAVGSSTARALEQAAQPDGRVDAQSGQTALFIRPGYDFRVVGGMLTNFHMPRSTLILLVCAFAGREHVLRAYREAVARKYRFLSFGDAMLIV